jgi:hypothetical protein
MWIIGALARQRGPRRAEVAAMDDDRLEAVARRLGEEGERRVNPERVVERVLDRLRSEPVEVDTRPRAGGRRWGRALAAAALVAAIGLGIRYPAEPVALATGLAELGPAELAEVIDSLEIDAPVGELVVGLNDLSEEQLETLLRRLEG